MVVRGGSLAFFPFDARGSHFDLSSAVLSYLARAPLLVNELGPDHLYSLESRLGSQ